MFIPPCKAIVKSHLDCIMQALQPFFKVSITRLERLQLLATRMFEGNGGGSYNQPVCDIDPS